MPHLGNKPNLGVRRLRAERVERSGYPGSPMSACTLFPPPFESALYFHRPLSPLHAQAAHARAAAAAVEPSDLLREAAAAAAAALPSVAEPACYSESDEGEGDPTSYPACGKPPRAPPRGRPTDAAVPGRRRVLDDDADTAKRRKKRRKGEGGQPGCMPAPQPGECPNDAQHMAHPNGSMPSAACRAAKQAPVSMQATAAQPSRQARHGGGPAPNQAGEPDQARGAAGADAQAAERARRERKRAKKLRQKQQRAAGAVSEEAAVLERARKARKKQRLKLARQRKRDAAAEAGS